MRIHLLRLRNRLSGLLATGARRITDDSGNSVVELALAFAFLLAPLLLGTAEVAFMVYDSIEVSNAAHAGAAYGSYSSTYAADTASILAAAQAEASDFSSSLTVTSTTYYACSADLAGTQYSTSTAAAAVCPASATNHYLYFVQVNSAATITPPILFPGLPKSWTLTGKSVMQVPLS